MTAPRVPTPGPPAPETPAPAPPGPRPPPPPGRGLPPIPAAEVPALAAATFTLSKLIVHEKVETWIRQPFVEEKPGGSRRPRGRRLRYAVGELLTCTRCTGAWTALALVGLRLHAPATARTVNTVLAESAGNDFLHAGFKWICARATSQEREAEHGPPALADA